MHIYIYVYIDMYVYIYIYIYIYTYTYKGQDLLRLRSPKVAEMYLCLLGGLAPSACLSLLSS